MRSRALLTEIGCRYSCTFCDPPRPYETGEQSPEKNRRKLIAEIESAPTDCEVFVIGGADCCEDLDLVFEVCDAIRRRWGDEPQIHLQSHCAELQDRAVVQQAIAHGISRIRLPVYGPTAEIHHRVMRPKTGVRIDGFPQLEAVAHCLASGKIAVTAHTVIAQGNAEHLVGTIDALGAIASEHRASIGYRVRPVLLTAAMTSGYLPMKGLTPFLKEAYARLVELNDEAVILDYYFDGFPFCLFERVDPRIRNPDFAGELQKHYTLFVGQQLPVAEWLYSKLDPRIPIYKIRAHDPICDRCLMRKYCAGFQQIDYERYGIGELEPFC